MYQAARHTVLRKILSHLGKYGTFSVIDKSHPPSASCISPSSPLFSCVQYPACPHCHRASSMKALKCLLIS